MFKVDVNLHSPLREALISEADFKVDLFVHSFQLDTFCKQEQLNKQVSSKGDYSKSGTSFQNKANLAYCNLQQTLTKYRGVMHNDTYEREPYYAQLFPSVVEYSKTGTSSNRQSPTSIDNYFKQLSHMNHVLMLARQIHKDIRCGEKPKYLAHQIAVLFQAIQALPSGSELLARHKTNIEDNFKMLKSTIADLHEFENSLPEEVEEWLLELTASIAGVIHSMPTQMTQELRPVASVFQSG